MLREQNILITRIRSFSLWLAAVLVIGTVGYSWIEGWTTGDGFYMSVITLATVGYGETRDLSQLGRLFTCALIFFSIVSLSCWTACLTSLFVDSEFTGMLKRKRVKKMASKLKKHTIICGSGTMAMAIINTLSRTQESLVVIDSDSKALSQINNRYPNVLTIEAKAVDEFALADANVLEAKCIVATLESDYDNLMISLTCKDLGTDIKIIARSNEMQVASRMMKLGVDDVICPFQLCGEHAAKLVCS